MGILARIFGRPPVKSPEIETRAFDPYFDWRFTSDIVLSNLAVAARCVQLRSEILASVPLFLFRRDANGDRERADDNPLYGVLHDIANPNQSTFELREFAERYSPQGDEPPIPDGSTYNQPANSVALGAQRGPTI